MKRYLVCKVYGRPGNNNIDDPKPWTPTTGPYRPSILDVVDPATGFQAFNVATVIGSHPAGHPQAGQPVHPWCLVIAAGENHKLAEGNPDIDALPEVSLDVKVSAVHVPTRVQMGQKLQARGIDTSFVGGADGFREVIRQLGKLQDATFDENKFDVSE